MRKWFKELLEALKDPYTRGLAWGCIGILGLMAMIWFLMINGYLR